MRLHWADATCRKFGRTGHWPYIALIVAPPALLLPTNYMRRSLPCHATDALKPMWSACFGPAHRVEQSGLPRATGHWVDVESFQDLGHPCSADPQVTGECGTALELAGIEKRLVVAGSFEGIAAFFLDRFRLRFGLQKGVPGEDGDDGRST